MYLPPVGVNLRTNVDQNCYLCQSFRELRLVCLAECVIPLILPHYSNNPRFCRAVYAAVSGGSLSLLATGIDSVFDFGSNVLLFWLHRKAARLDVNKWPVGGARLETIGNITYGEYS